MTGHSTSVLVPCSCFSFRPSPTPKGGQSSPLLFSSYLLCPNSHPSHLLLSTCTNGRSKTVWLMLSDRCLSYLWRWRIVATRLDGLGRDFVRR